MDIMFDHPDLESYKSLDKCDECGEIISVKHPAPVYIFNIAIGKNTIKLCEKCMLRFASLLSQTSDNYYRVIEHKNQEITWLEEKTEEAETILKIERGN